MAETPAQDVKTLFKRWRSGDADAGVTMAQRFSDWYYAITVMRLGDQNARAPLERACQTFAQRIMDITNADELIDFAHHIVLEEVRGAGNQAKGGDFANAMTAGKLPSTLLADAAESLPRAQVSLLHSTYAGDPEKGRSNASLPLDALHARHALKQWLADNAGIPFTVLPEAPNLDCAPLPLYEAARLNGVNEERAFEQWLLSDLDLCKDIAEFSAFAHALRDGALRSGQRTPQVAAPKPQPTPPPEQPAPPTPRPVSAPEPSGGTNRFVMIAILGAVIVAALILAKMVMG